MKNQPLSKMISKANRRLLLDTARVISDIQNQEAVVLRYESNAERFADELRKAEESKKSAINKLNTLHQRLVLKRSRLLAFLKNPRVRNLERAAVAIRQEEAKLLDTLESRSEF